MNRTQAQSFGDVEQFVLFNSVFGVEGNREYFTEECLSSQCVILVNVKLFSRFLKGLH